MKREMVELTAAIEEVWHATEYLGPASIGTCTLAIALVIAVVGVFVVVCNLEKVCVHWSVDPSVRP